jgi:hypothetical protein
MGIWLRPRRADWRPYRKVNVAGVVRGVITRMPFSLLYKIDGLILTAVAEPQKQRKEDRRRRDALPEFGHQKGTKKPGILSNTRPSLNASRA